MRNDHLTPCTNYKLGAQRLIAERQCQPTNENEIYKLNAIEERICSAKMHMIAMLMRKLTKQTPKTPKNESRRKITTKTTLVICQKSVWN